MDSKSCVTARTATARKLAVIIWNMNVKKVPYIPQTEYQFLDQNNKKITAMIKLISKFDISSDALDFTIVDCGVKAQS